MFPFISLSQNKCTLQIGFTGISYTYLKIVKNGTPLHTYGYASTGWKDLLTSFDGTSITYDQIGNPNNWRDGMAFTWQAGRQLASLQKGTTGVSYTYSSDGTRLTKTVNGVKTSYTWDGAQLISQTTTGGDTLYFLYHGSSRVGLEYKGNTYYYIYNLQGDVVGLVNSSGTSVVSYTYDAWGNPESTTGSMASTLGAANPFRYRGYYYDTESGLYYLMSRYYDPVVGRFLNADEQLSANNDIQSYNLYSYCSNNPIMKADATGNSAVGTIIAVIAEITNLSLETARKQVKKQAIIESSNSTEPVKIDGTSYQYGIRYINQLPGNKYFNADYWGSYSSKSGCAVSSVSMALYSLGYDLLPKDIIKNNGGTVLMYWGKQGVKYNNEKNLDVALDKYLNNPNSYAPPVVNINNNSHWVTVVGRDGAGGYLYLDPDGTRKWQKYNWKYGTIIQYYKG